jgi:DNA-binding response OmpR family regulator
LSKESPAKDSTGQHVGFTFDYPAARTVPKIFVVCDQKDTAPVWGYILRQQGLIVVLEPSIEKAMDHWSLEAPDLVVIDLAMAHQDRMELYERFRAVSVAPILLFLPTHHETQILEAYTAGVDEVVIKPISPAIFLAKIVAWERRSWSTSVDELSPVKAGRHRLDPAHRCMINPEGQEIKLSNLEFSMLHLLMCRPGHIFNVEHLIQSIWGGFGTEDQALLKNVIYRLRRKIEVDPSHPRLLQTWQRGYSFQE